MIAYDPRGMDWPQYCKLMVELFSLQGLGNVEEENWTSWADNLSRFGYFEKSGIPDSRGFVEWQDWAKQVCGILSVETL